MQDNLQHILKTAETEISGTVDLSALDLLRVQYLGKKGQLTEYLKNLVQLSPEERPSAGQAVNLAKVQLQEAISKRVLLLKQVQLQAQLASETVDVTLPGRSQDIGSIHPVTLAKERIATFFASLGFRVEEGPEVETEYYNFEALNIPPEHPARAMHDTFYCDNGMLLRTHTSPVQMRAMETTEPPLKIIAMGRVYRNDSDVTHSPMFHQLEGLVVDENADFAQLKGLLESFVNYFFEQKLPTRLRPTYFPFTEPSAELDIQCVICNGTATGCRVCKQTGWLEVLGCGMVHPKVLAAGKVDSQRYRGFAFGVGLDRLVMLRYRIDDLRVLFENDVRFLKQF